MRRFGAFLVAGVVSAGIVFATAPAAQAADQDSRPPVISLLSPAPGESFSQSWEILLYAEASDPDGTIAKVEFYDGQRRLAVVTSGLYFTAIRPGRAAIGTHTLKAVAYDDDGLTATAEVAVNVRPPVLLQIPGRVVAGVESGCMMLEPDEPAVGSAREYMLIGGDKTVLVSGAHVLVTGEIMSGVVSYCMQGTPLRVVSAQPF